MALKILSTTYQHVQAARVHVSFDLQFVSFLGVHLFVFDEPLHPLDLFVDVFHSLLRNLKCKPHTTTGKRGERNTQAHTNTQRIGLNEIDDA